MGRRRRRVLAGGPADRTRSSGPRPGIRGRLDDRPDTRAVQCPDRRARVRRRLVRRHGRDGRLLEPSGRAPVPARPRRGRARPAHPGGPVPVRRPAPRPRPATLLRCPRGPHRRGRGDEHHRHDPARRRRSTGAGRGLGLRGRAAPVARRRPPGLARVGPPGHAVGCDPAAGGRVRAGRDARRVGSRRGRAGRIDRPAGVVAGRNAPPDQRSDRLVEPLPAGRGSAPRAPRAHGGRVRRPGLDLRSIVVRVPRRRRDRGHRPERRPGPPLPDRARPAGRRDRDAVHGARRAARR